MARNVSIDQLGDAIANELTMYSREVTDGIKRETQKSIKKLVKETKATAPVGKRTKHYRDNISSRKLEETDRGAVYQWYVKGPDYRLSHLLENGHALKDGGRYEGTGFIHKAEVSIVEEFEKAVEEVVRNGK